MSTTDAETIVASVFTGTASVRNRLEDRIANAAVVEGHDLEQDKSALVGVPFLITGVSVRDGVMRGPDKKNLTPTNYLSVEVMIYPAADIAKRVKRGFMTEEQANRFSPEDQVVFNDGSSGVARQLLAYMHASGYIRVPEGKEAGEVGECRYDVYRTEWLKGFSLDEPNPHFSFDLACPRGLRVSNYANEMGDAATYYLG